MGFPPFSEKTAMEMMVYLMKAVVARGHQMLLSGEGIAASPKRSFICKALPLFLFCRRI